MENNLKNKKKEDWIKIAESRFKKDVERRKRQKEEEQRLVTNNINLANKELIEQQKNREQKKHIHEHIEKAQKIRERLFRFEKGYKGQFKT